MACVATGLPRVGLVIALRIWQVAWMFANLEAAQRVPSLVPHLPYILMPLDEMIDEFMERKALNVRAPAGVFLEAMKEQISIDAYAEVQERHLSQPMLEYLATLGGGSALEKYLNFPVWAASKFKIAHTLGIYKGNVKRVLDLGAGPGHFGLAARYMGADYVGLDYTGRDAPFVLDTPIEDHIYDDLFRVFGLERIDARITPHEPLNASGRFDLVTCLMGIFPVYITSAGSTPWAVQEWRFFLRDLIENVMAERFTMFFQIAPAYFAPVLNWLTPLCREMNPMAGTFTIDETIDLAAM